MRHPMTLHRILPVVLALSGASAHTAPALRCVIDSTGNTLTHEARITNNPYAVQPVSVNRHFRFKAVVVGDAQAGTVDHVQLYTQYQGARGPVLLHQVGYTRPVVNTAPQAPSLTGLHWVYSPQRERQFQFECRWHEVQP
ncbi:hypothetical protein [Hydrogenophaga sp.]|uniref:hypothetical protein n=2 Tax=Hydrogenophaga sp. TaxID=1904254 RepID=UPI00262ED0CC|nr:hypothetical protein [Hydrogenophaga sp.]